MIYLLYNIFSNKGKCYKTCLKLEKKIKKKGHECEVVSIVDIASNIDEFVNRLTEDDIVYIIGGDGTIHNIINSYDLKKVPSRLFYCQGGSGNDFSRNRKNKKFFEVTSELKNLPYFDIEGRKREYFVNGVGLGIDADVCSMVAKDKMSYLKATLKCLNSFKPYSLDLNVDGKKMHFDDVCFFVVMNGKYFGGGMKIAPHADRYDGLLDLLIITKKNPKSLIPILPSVFIGKHVYFKKIVSEYKCKQVHAVLSRKQNLQSDGEVIFDIKEISVSI